MNAARRRIASVVATLLAFAIGDVAAQAAEVDPDSAQMHAKALEALPRAQKLAVNGDALKMEPETRAIAGLNLGVEGKSEDLSGLLRDLNAEVRGKEVRIALSADVLFDFDKADLRAEAAPSLGKVVSVLKSYPKATATIDGHADGKGDAGYNQKLSQRRAESVRKWLAEHGAVLRMTTRGLGKTKPVAPNTTPDGKDDPQGRQKNRRVEIVVTQG